MIGYVKAIIHSVHVHYLVTGEIVASHRANVPCVTILNRIRAHRNPSRLIGFLLEIREVPSYSTRQLETGWLIDAIPEHRCQDHAQVVRTTPNRIASCLSLNSIAPLISVLMTGRGGFRYIRRASSGSMRTAIISFQLFISSTPDGLRSASSSVTLRPGFAPFHGHWQECPSRRTNPCRVPGSYS